MDNLNKESLVKLITNRLSRQGLNLVGSRPDKFIQSKRFLIKIQDGCNRFCSYCVVPYLRGLPQSKTISNIVKEIKLAQKDTSEVILTAINTEAFGQDTGESFIELIKQVLAKTKIKRLSFGSIHPWSINNEFLKYYSTIASSKRFIHFFHIPLQSGSNKILQLMKRNYTREEIELKLMEIKKLNPFALIATDVIVGFLDETDEDFQETYEFLEKSPISKFHVFRFSKRAGTAAFHMTKKLKEPTGVQKKQRAKVLIDLSQKKYQAFLEKHVAKTFPALFLQEKVGEYRKCLLGNQIPALVKTNKNLSGEIKTVKITKLDKGNLIGKES